MMWTETTRTEHACKEQRLPSVLTDREWEGVEPFFAPPSFVGRPRKWPTRIIVDASRCLVTARTSIFRIYLIGSAAASCCVAKLWHKSRMTSKRIFMLGATGTIGRATHDALVQCGHEVVSFARAGSKFR
jgi:hypothetical protein